MAEDYALPGPDRLAGTSGGLSAGSAVICFGRREFIWLENTDAGWSSSVARWAHNPEVAGSNPAPATKFAGQRPLPIMEGAFCMCRVHGIVHEASEEGRRSGWAVRRTPRTS